LEDMCVGGRIILKWILKKLRCEVVGLIDIVQVRDMWWDI